MARVRGGLALERKRRAGTVVPVWSSVAGWRLLACLPVFAACPRRQLRTIARWGDLVEVDQGQTVVRQGKGDYWFIVVVAGQLRLIRDGATVEVIGPGSHLGERVVVGLRPQPTTARADARCVLFLLGPRYAFSLFSTSRELQKALFPEVGPGEYERFAKRMNAEGRAEWQALVPDTPVALGPHPNVSKASADWLTTRLTDLRSPQTRPGRPVSLGAAALLFSQLPRPTPPPPRPVMTRSQRRGLLLAGAFAALVSTALLLFMYHPPRLVVTPGRPVDVVGDISIRGAPTHPVHGRYLLLWVSATQPNLAGYLSALWHHETMVGADSASSSRAGAAAAHRAGRQAYLDSQTAAVSAVLARDHLDPRLVKVRIQDRGLVGPSGGLAYALALESMLSGHDLARGGVLAATGQIATGGEIEAVGWVPVKVESAQAAGASVLVVPTTEMGAAAGWGGQLLGVASLDQAIAELRGP